MQRRERWCTAVAVIVGASLLALGGPADAQEPTPAAMIYVGDSIGVQSEDEIIAELSTSRPLTHYFSANGATIAESRQQVAEVVQGEDPPSILVVGLGHADVAWSFSWPRHERDLRRFLDDTAPFVDCVRWLDVKPGGTLYRHFNPDARRWNVLLNQIAAEYPNVEVMHYSAWTAAAAPGSCMPTACTTALPASGRWGASFAKPRTDVTPPVPPGRSGTSGTMPGRQERSPGWPTMVWPTATRTGPTGQ